MGAFKEPYGGTLKVLYLGESAADEARASARDLPSWDLTARQLCDIELLLNGAFSPLEGFLTRDDYDRVLTEMRLASGVLWPIPITLDVSRGFAETVSVGDTIALRDAQGVLLATLEIEDLWEPDKRVEAAAVLGTESVAHPGVDYLLNRAGDVYLGGRLTGVEPPVHYDFKLLRDSPSELRGRFRKLGWRRVVAFETGAPMHRAEQALTFAAARQAEANLLIHPIVGMAQPGDLEHYTRVRCYEHILEQYPEQTTTLSLLNLATRMAGPREAIWHAIVRRNFGCTHFIVRPAHAEPGDRPNAAGPFYGIHDAQELYAEHEQELDITMLPVEEMVYVEDRGQHLPTTDVTPDMTVATLSDVEFRRRLDEGTEIPSWYSYPRVVEELRRSHPPRHEQGFTVFFTGLSGAGKSAIAKALQVKLLEIGGRRVTLLGDVVRQHLSSELGFSREHRDVNVLRIGFVAAEITKNGGIALCAPIAPYAMTRRQVREIVSSRGGFIEVYVATPLEVCERRDRTGHYKQAREGLIEGFTGISDPYEEPEHAELEIDTQGLTPELAAHRVLVKIESMGYIR